MNGLSWRVAVLVLGIAAVIALFWLASEAHYESCVDAAAATTAAPTSDLSGNPFDRVDRGAERDSAVAGCSHSPF